jgi:methylated-DNA-[protein]-cysteine S-methyltransferase
MQNLIQFKYESVIGPIYLVASDLALVRLQFKKQSNIAFITDPRAFRIIAQTILELDEYFQGQRQKFTIPLALEGTPFQRTVWNELQKLPYGKTNSYKELAQNIKNTKAARAVGTANGKNPICIIIPCHRIISSDGSLGGFSGGLKIKSKLLQLETRRN